MEGFGRVRRALEAANAVIRRASGGAWIKGVRTFGTDRPTRKNGSPGAASLRLIVQRTHGIERAQWNAMLQ